MADMAEAEEQLRRASDLMLELQQRLVEAQPQARPRPAVQPYGAPSTLPREAFPREATACEERPNTPVSPGRDVAGYSRSAWEAGPGVLRARHPGLETRGGEMVAGPNPGALKGAVDCEWQGGTEEAGEVRGGVGPGGCGDPQREAFQCSAGPPKGYVVAATAAETEPSPRPGSFLPLSIEVNKEITLRYSYKFTSLTAGPTHLHLDGGRKTLR